MVIMSVVCPTMFAHCHTPGLEDSFASCLLSPPSASTAQDKGIGGEFKVAMGALDVAARRSPSHPGRGVAAPLDPSVEAVLAGAGDAFFTCDGRAMLSWANESCRRLLGVGSRVDPDALVARLSPDGRQDVWHYCSRMLQGRDVSSDLELNLHMGEIVEVPATLRLGTIASAGTLLGRLAVAQHFDVPGTDTRLENLERTLKRFSQDLHALGFAAQASAGDDRRVIPRDLPDRQSQVVSLMLSGLDVGEIAAALYLSPHTVRNHAKAAFRVLEVHSRAELFKRYRRP
jgi:DNA-binding CsgD family transcriptional regulator